MISGRRRSMPLKPGDKAPEINLLDHEGNVRSNKIQNNTLVVFFYPKDDTPGCTAEACGFRDNYDLFKVFGAEVWGVSGDNQESHSKFSKRNKLPFPLLVDKNNKLRKAFGVPNVVGLIPGRVTYIIDSKGVIRHIFNNLLNGPAHVNNALMVLEKIRQDN